MKQKTTLGMMAAITAACSLLLSPLTLAGTVTFTPPPENEAPRQTAGGASRNSSQCLSESTVATLMEPSVQPLMPESRYGTTISERPTILVYMPATSAREAFFSVQDENRRLHYKSDIPISGEEGIVAIELPEEATALEEGKNYQWYFVLKCNGKLHPRNPSANGWIKRVEANWAADPGGNRGANLEDAASLGAAGVWYDTVATVGLLRKTLPTDPEIAENWQDLLDSVGLGAISEAPMIESLHSASGMR